MKVTAMKIINFVLVAGIALLSQNSFASVAFSDDFESGNLNLWTQQIATPLAIANIYNVAPVGGTYSAWADSSTDRMWHNLGTELGGHTMFSYYLYDDTLTRAFGQVSAYSGAGFQDGTLQQLFAIGKYNQVTMPGEVYDASKYQGRIVFSSGAEGWFNLNSAGVTSRSAGWHKFSIERLADGTSVNFYVDDVLGRSFTGVDAADWDSIALGLGAGVESGNAYYDGVKVDVVAAAIPEPPIWALVMLGGIVLMATGVRRRAV